MDFTSIDKSTAALINPKNHHLNGRDLVVEYASLDAVRRGGSNVGGAVARKRRPLSAGYKKTRGRKEGEAAQDDHKKKVGEEMGTKSRPRPGAALAQAKRETAAIVPSQGKKIIF